MGLAKAKLANILAVMTRQAHAIGSGVPNAYAQSVEGVRELEAFAAVIYSSRVEMDAALSGKVNPESRTGAGETAVENGEKEREKGLFEGVWGRITG